MIRTELAILDHNINLNREQTRSKTGELRYRLVHPKRTKEWVATPLYEQKTHDWQLEIQTDVIQLKMGLKTAIDILLPALPANIATCERPPRTVVIEQHKSRFQNHQFKQ